MPGISKIKYPYISVAFSAFLLISVHKDNQNYVNTLFDTKFSKLCELNGLYEIWHYLLGIYTDGIYGVIRSS